MKRDLRELLRRLQAPDPRRAREAGQHLLRHGDAAVAPLIALDRDAAPGTRRSIAFLLGRLPPSPDSRATLVQALKDDDPRLRRIAAESVGRLGGAAGVAALEACLAAEDAPDVRRSAILALGAIQTPAAAAVLATTEARSPGEAEALRKARARATPERATARWAAPPEQRVWLKVPPGLEDVAAAEAEEVGVTTGPARPGWLAVTAPADPEALAALRCTEEARFGLATAPADPSPRGLADLLRGAPMEAVAQRIACSAPELPYRFSVEGAQVSRRVRWSLLGALRAALEPQGWVDNPSGYVVELILELTRRTSRLWLVPRFGPDPRFAYRRADVGASIAPTVGAGLARLVRQPGSETVLDPTCGSATLLVERARLDAGVRLQGLDVSPTAVAAARDNVAAAGLADRIAIALADTTRIAWEPVDEVLANLPFGLRSRTQDRDLPALYDALVQRVSDHLAPAGQALLYTANRRLLDDALHPRADRLQWTSRVIQTGGLHVGAWLVRRRSAP